MAPTIRVIGSLNADMVSITPRFPEPGETITSSGYFTSAGGKGANQAVACGRLSRPKPSSSSSNPTTTTITTPVAVEIVGAVGALDGHFQSLLQPTLTESGVDTSRIKLVSDAYTGVAVIIVDSSAGGENRIIFTPGANYSGMKPTRETVGMALASPMPDVIVMQGEIPVETTVEILRAIGEMRRGEQGRGGGGPEVMLNPAPAPPGGLPVDVYGAVDHLILNETEAELMGPGGSYKGDGEGEGEGGYEKVAQYFHDLGVGSVVITLGSRGVWYSPRGRFTNRIPAARVSRVLDTTAAGDTFVGAYAVSVARWRSHSSSRSSTTTMKDEEQWEMMVEAMERATRASARAVERQGAMDSIPWEDEI